MMPSHPPPLIHVSQIRPSIYGTEDESELNVKQEFQPPTEDPCASAGEVFACEESRVPIGWRVTLQPVFVPASRSLPPQAFPSGREYHIVIPPPDTCAVPRDWNIPNPTYGCGVDDGADLCGHGFRQNDHTCSVADDIFPVRFNLRSRQSAQKKSVQLTMPDATKHSRSNEESLSCFGCDASYRTNCELNRHILVSHIRPYECPICNRKFGQKNYLRIHIETVHRKERNYPCQTCGKCLSTSGNLKVHIRTVHLGEKKYTCHICSKAFGQRCNLKTHLMRHKARTDLS